MKEKVNHNGYCLNCGKESKQPFCDRKCYRAYVKSNDPTRKKREEKERTELSDRVVKRTIYIGSKGNIKYNQITPEMIIEKRAAILAWRERKVNPQPKQKPIKHCKICGKEIVSGVYCGDECEKEQRRRESFQRNKAKKILKVRPCKECGMMFMPEYGNKRRDFCSDKCLHRNGHRIRRHKERAKLRLVKVETVDPIKVFKRDGWICQICKCKLRNKDRGTYKDTAPELDHIIPLSKGGEHSYRNTQCACRKCNADKKGNVRGQIRLFG